MFVVCKYCIDFFASIFCHPAVVFFVRDGLLLHARWYCVVSISFRKATSRASDGRAVCGTGAHFSAPHRRFRACDRRHHFTVRSYGRNISTCKSSEDGRVRVCFMLNTPSIPPPPLRTRRSRGTRRWPATERCPWAKSTSTRTGRTATTTKKTAPLTTTPSGPRRTRRRCR